MKYKKLFLQKNLDLNNPAKTTVYTLKDFLRGITLNPEKFKSIESALSGILKSKNSGTGFDFHEIREYIPGDDLRHISWTTTARTGNLHTKEYYPEKETYSYFLLDVSNSMLCGNKLKTLLNTFAFLLNLASVFSEKIGGIFFADEIKYSFPFSASSTQANLMFDTLIKSVDSSSNKNSETPYLNGTDFSKPLDFVKRYFSRKGFLFIISDLLFSSSFEEKIFEATQKQNVYFFQIYDPIDFNLPPSGYVTFIDPENNQRFTVNTDNNLIRGNYNSYMLDNQKRIGSFMRTIGAHHLTIEKGDYSLKSKIE